MSVPSVVLAGGALTGIDPEFSVYSRPGRVTNQQVSLGRKRLRANPQCFKLSNYIDYSKVVLPTSVDWSAKAAPSITRMYNNDRLGCCVFSSAFHQFGLWSGNDSDSGGIILATDREVQDQYFTYTGGGDDGAVISEVLDITRDRGLIASGKRYKIDGYVSIDWTNKVEAQAAICLFASIKLGINFPSSWSNSAVWDTTNSQIVGGHDVPCLGYDERGVTIASWARKYLITWAAFTSQRWLEEAYVVLAPQWYGNDRLAPNGLDVETLRADLVKLGGGVIPDIDPTPPPIPPTPIPPVPSNIKNLGLSLVFNNWRTGPSGRPIADVAGTATNLSSGGPGDYYGPYNQNWWPIIIEFGFKALPIIISGILAHKTVIQILLDIYAAFGPPIPFGPPVPQV